MKKIKILGMTLDTFMGIFISLVTVIAAWTSNQSGDYIQEANDLNRQSLNHLVNASNWWNYYQAHRLRVTLFENDIIDESGKDVFKILEEYDDKVSKNNTPIRQELLDTLKGEGVNTAKLDSYLTGLEKSSLKYKDGQEYARNAEKAQAKAADAAAVATDYATAYQVITLILVISMGLGGIAVILNIPGLAFGSILVGVAGILHLLLILFAPGIVGLTPLN
ncbi:DUF4337 family protein [Candidatus Micrarchaeota archaeon]|nr:DUF4337 family protein [Candidatus Micrarchaeota archaeon]